VRKLTSPLENLCGPGKSLRAEPPDAEEFAGLKRSGRKRLADAQNASNSLPSSLRERSPPPQAADNKA
jgi:hypothetical protein